MALLLLAPLLLIGAGQTTPLATPGTPVSRPFVASRKAALCIGVGGYEHLSNLSYTVDDARSVAAELKEDYGFDPANVRLLDGATAATIPTAATVAREIKTLVEGRNLDGASLFVFYFSGHGIGTKSGDYLMPRDAKESEAETKGIAMRPLVRALASAGLKNVLFVCDACRAGEKNPFGAELQALGRRTNLAVLLGCAPGGRSYEYDSLGHGAFTHYLLKALKSPASADPTTGAVLGSKLAAKVARSVAEYTAADHGDSPQVPSVWTAEKGITTDVFLGCRPPEGEIGAGALAIAREQLGKGELARTDFGRLVLSLGIALFGESRYSEAVDCFKAADELGEAPDPAAAWLVSSLLSTGRDAEAERYLRRLLASKSPYWRDQAMALDSLGITPAAQRLAARERLYAGGRTFEEAFDLWYALSRTGMTGEALAARLDGFAADMGPKTAAGLYFAARAALARGEDLKAVDLAFEGFRAPPGGPERHDFVIVLAQAAHRLGSKELELKILTLGTKIRGHEAYWEAQVAILTGAAPSLAQLIRAIETATNARGLVEIAASAGADVPALIPALEAAGARFPGTWEPRFALWLARQEGRFRVPLALDPKAFGAEATPGRFFGTATDALVDMFSALERAKRMGKADRKRLTDFLLAELCRKADLFGDPAGDGEDAWRTLLVQTSLSGYPRQAYVAALPRLLPRARSLPPVLRYDLLEACVVAGDLASARTLFVSGPWDAPDANGGDLVFAAALASEGAPDARAVLASIVRPLTRAETGIRDAIAAYLDARDGRPSAGGEAPKGFVAAGLRLAGRLLDPAYVPAPSEIAAALEGGHDAEAPFGYPQALLAVAEALRRRSAPGDADAWSAARLAIESLGFPDAARRLALGTPGEPKAFAGRYVFRGKWNDDPARAVLTLTPDGRGTLEGIPGIPSLPIVWRDQGWLGVPKGSPFAAFEGKLAPRAAYDAPTSLRGETPFALYRPSGERLGFVGVWEPPPKAAVPKAKPGGR